MLTMSWWFIELLEQNVLVDLLAFYMNKVNCGGHPMAYYWLTEHKTHHFMFFEISQKTLLAVYIQQPQQQ